MPDMEKAGREATPAAGLDNLTTTVHNSTATGQSKRVGEAHQKSLVSGKKTSRKLQVSGTEIFKSSRSSQKTADSLAASVMPAAIPLFTPQRLVNWLFDQWHFRFSTDGFLEYWDVVPGLVRGPLACIMSVRDHLGLTRISDDDLALGYQTACDERIVKATRDADCARRRDKTGAAVGKPVSGSTPDAIDEGAGR